jgi:hypothetical protein
MESLRATEIFNDSRFRLIAVESVSFQCSKTNASGWLYGNIETIAVIVCGPDEIYALDMDAKLIVLEQLRQDVPGLDAIIGPRNKT